MITHFSGPPTPERVPARLDAALPVQAEGAGAAGAPNAGHSRLSRAQALLRPPERGAGHIHHLPVSCDI